MPATSKRRRDSARSAKSREEIAPYEAKLSDFEYALWHLGAAFARWRRDCLRSVDGRDLNSTEASLLHVIHLSDTPKGVMDICRLLHRDDLANIQYGLKKLGGLGLVQKHGRSRKSMTYTVTEEGRAIVEAYLERRREILLRLFMQVAPSTEDLTDLIMQMHVMIGIYDQSSGLVMNHQP